MYRVILVGKDGFTKEEDLFYDAPPARLSFNKHIGCVCSLDKDAASYRCFYLLKNFWAFGCNVLLYCEA